MDSIGGVQGTPYGTGEAQTNVQASNSNAFALLFAELMSSQMDRALFSGLGSADDETDGMFSDTSMFSMFMQLAGGNSGLIQGSNLSAVNAAYGIAPSATTGYFTGNSSAAGMTGLNAAESALTRLGDPYSQAKRGTGNYVDCSSLTQGAYRNAGVSLPGTAAEQAKYCVQKGYTIEKQDLQPGDLVFWQKSGCNCGRYDEIHHVGIYLGDGKVVEASSSKGKVVVSDLWGESGAGKWKVAFYARPY